jgi:hypothetical protein
LRQSLAEHLGFSWARPDASGLQALLWRDQWESTNNDEIKRLLIQYNAGDCEALEIVTRFVSELCREDQKESAAPEYVRVEKLKPQGHFLINKDGAALPEFKAINKAAYWDYQRLRVYVRTSKVIQKACRQPKRPTRSHAIKSTVMHPAPKECMSCGGTDLSHSLGEVALLVHDIKFIRHGAKAWITRHTFRRCFCRQCNRPVRLAAAHPFTFRKYGPNLRAYAVDHLIRLNIPLVTVAKSLSDLFGFDLAGEHISEFKADFASLYVDTVKEITTSITKGPLVHADETAARVVGKSAVVWVLASMEAVVFLYSDTREGEMVQGLLRGFSGVLVSDFYVAYDAIKCPQQKCLIHLMRDLNDDLHRYPFDLELRSVAEKFGCVLKPIVETIDRYGLKVRFLNKHRPPVRRFLDWVTTQEFQSEVAQKYGQRFRKNKEKVFLFLSYDGVPWNNNNAENARAERQRGATPGLARIHSQRLLI